MLEQCGTAQGARSFQYDLLFAGPRVALTHRKDEAVLFPGVCVQAKVQIGHVWTLICFQVIRSYTFSENACVVGTLDMRRS